MQKLVECEIYYMSFDKIVARGGYIIMQRTKAEYKNLLAALDERIFYLNTLISTAGTPEGVQYSGTNPKTIKKNVSKAKSELIRLNNKKKVLLREQEGD